MKVAMLSRYERIGASSRLRLIQYSGYLKAKGLDSYLAPFFDEDYLFRRYAGGRLKVGAVASAYVRRVGQLLGGGERDLIWLEKEALPWAPWLIEHMLLPSGVPVVVDLDDAVFHQYDLHRFASVRSVLGGKLNNLMASAALVTAGNQYLADRAAAAGARRVELVPTVVDLAAYTSRPTPVAGSPSIIGWIGTPSTWTAYIAPMLSLLVGVAEKSSARLMTVGAGVADSIHHLHDSVPWTEDTEISRIHAMDIGIMPLIDTPWARGKCGYKLIQYMACGLPVIASPVGVNVDIVEHGVNGFLAATPAEWRDALTALLADAGLRQKMGAAGRKKVEEHYSLQLWGPRVASLLRKVADEQHTR